MRPVFNAQERQPEWLTLLRSMVLPSLHRLYAPEELWMRC